ncbi:MAG: hypothetical protein ABI821_15555 [Pseudomonadota bacterium]
MRTLPVLVAGLLVISGCGGGGHSEADPSTGMLEAGKALGVHYQTATQSGTTDANGTFTYLPGETVTFSIGGVQLGAVSGAAKISLFTLAGLTPPLSELALRRELERAQRQPTPMVRAMNLARLLIALDADNNPDNGIDVSGRAADLAGKQIDLGLGLYGFAAKVDRLAPNLTRNIPITRTLVFAYQAANLTVSVHNAVRNDVDEGVFSQRSSTISYLANGLRSREESAAVGLSVGSSVATYSYDGLGRMTGYASVSQLDPVTPDYAISSAFSFDARGNRVTSAYEQQFFGDLRYRFTSGGAADARGLFPEITATTDNDGDGVIDLREVTQTTFDARGNPVSRKSSDDNDGDGVFDVLHSFTTAFGVNDRISTETYEIDSDADGDPDYRRVTSLDESTPGLFIRTELEDFDVDGTIDQSTTLRVQYDAAGNQVSESLVAQGALLGLGASSYTTTTTYDADHRVLTRDSSEDYDSDGTPDRTTRSTYEYDAQGNPVKATSALNDTFSGSQNFGTDYEYGANGERTMFRYHVDYDADGVFEFESATQVTNQLFDDGVLMLGQQYFEFIGAPAFDYVGVVVGGAAGGVASH